MGSGVTRAHDRLLRDYRWKDARVVSPRLMIPLSIPLFSFVTYGLADIAGKLRPRLRAQSGVWWFIS